MVPMAMKYTIKTVAQMTGLSVHTIRAWERRHHVLSPTRTITNRRVYEDAEVEQLRLLGRAVEFGHAIGQISHLSTEELRSLTEFSVGTERHPSSPSVSASTSSGFLIACESAMDRMAADSLEQTLVRAGAVLGMTELLEGVVVPLVERISVRWTEGTTTIAQEHMATAVLRAYLEGVRTSMHAPTQAPRLLVTTPRNQFHEIGALIVSIVASIEGWNVTYLGPNLPAEEIANATRQCAAHAVGLSIVFPNDDPTLADELKLLHKSLGPAVSILIGGRAASHYIGAIEAIGAHNVQTLSGLRESLNQIRRGPG